MSLNHTVVVGASLAGVTVVDALRAFGYDGRITVLGDEPHPPYARPPLSKALLVGDLTEADVTLPGFDERAELRLGCRAASLHLARREVTLGGGEVLSYDGVVVATGSRARTLAPPGVSGELTLRSLDDARSLRERLLTPGSVAVVGGGFLGMEIASSCADKGCTVTVFDVAAPLEAHLGPWLAGIFEQAAGEHGVAVRVCQGGTSLVSDAGRVVGVRAADDTLHADLVISAAGELPNVEWLRGSGVRLRDGVLCDTQGRIGPAAVAAGDVAVFGGLGGSHGRTPHFSSAIAQARTAASALLHGRQAIPHEPNEYFWTDAFGLRLKAYGQLPAAGAPTVIDGSREERRALLVWPAPSGSPRGTAVALNYPFSQRKLRRLAHEYGSTPKELAL